MTGLFAQVLKLFFQAVYKLGPLMNKNGESGQPYLDVSQQVKLMDPGKTHLKIPRAYTEKTQTSRMKQP